MAHRCFLFVCFSFRGFNGFVFILILLFWGVLLHFVFGVFKGQVRRRATYLALNPPYFNLVCFCFCFLYVFWEGLFVLFSLGVFVFRKRFVVPMKRGFSAHFSLSPFVSPFVSPQLVSLPLFTLSLLFLSLSLSLYLSPSLSISLYLSLSLSISLLFISSFLSSLFSFFFCFLVFVAFVYCLVSLLLFHEKNNFKILISKVSLISPFCFLVSCLVLSFKSLYLIFVAFFSWAVFFCSKSEFWCFNKETSYQTQCLVKLGVATNRF